MKLILFILFSINTFVLNAQSIAINNDGSYADSSAMLDVKSSTKGVLISRMGTNQRTTIVNPAKGLLVFDTTSLSLWFYSGSSWLELRGVGALNFWQPHSGGIYYNGGRVGIGTSPHSVYPLYVRQPNTGNGNGVAHFESDDVWHSAINIKSNTSGRQFALVVGGANNLELKPNNFGLHNSNITKWSMVVDGVTNYVAFGSPNINTPLPKSTVHVLTGDVNIEQIGKGIIMKSPNGQCWRVTIDDTGNFVRTAITCP
jgi:hypothetical protein